MRVRGVIRAGLAGLLLAVVVVSGAYAQSPFRPQTGLYKAKTSTGGSFTFRVLKATCPPPVRGGAQHQKKGFCFVPISEFTFDQKCPSGAEIHDEGYALFEELLSSTGKLAEPETSSDGTTGVFHVTVARNGHASGYIEVITIRQPYQEGEAAEKCPSGRITFTASRG